MRVVSVEKCVLYGMVWYAIPFHTLLVLYSAPILVRHQPPPPISFVNKIPTQPNLFLSFPASGLVYFGGFHDLLRCSLSLTLD